MRTLAAAVIGGLMLLAAQPAPALAVPIQGSAIAAPTLIEPVACRVVHKRIVRPSGRVVRKTVRTCSRAHVRHHRHCRVKKVRTVRPNGRVVFKTVRRCR